MRRFLPYLLALAFLTSCVETIVMDPLEEMPVVIKCILSRDKNDSEETPPTQYLDLFYAKRPSESTNQIITDATVVVAGNGANHVFNWNGERWERPFLPEFGSEYLLTITLPGGQIVSAKTTFPPNAVINGCEVFRGYSNLSYAKYYTISGCDDDAHIWITPVEGRTDIRHFCTNHPYADNSNIVPGFWHELEGAKLIMGDFHLLKKNWGKVVDNTIINHYYEAAYYTPIHKDYLRIYHPKDFDNGIADNLVQSVYNGSRPYSKGFIITTDDIGFYTPPRWTGPAMTQLPIKVFFLSREYDLYLGECIKKSLHKDELASLYSFSPNYTNIDGGIGIFGSEYHYEYVR